MVAIRTENLSKTHRNGWGWNKTAAAALMFAASTLFLAGCCTTPQHATAKWEYQKVWNFEAVQNLSAEGWVLDGFH